MQRIVINGVPADYLPAMDRGLQYGDGVFETIACVHNQLQFWQQHISRMRTAAQKLKIEFPGEAAYLKDIRSLLVAGDEQRALVFKLMLTRGVGERGYRPPAEVLPCRLVIKTPLPAQPARVAQQGARVTLCAMQVSVNPLLAGIKHLNRLDNVLARNEWQDEFDEGLMCDQLGNIIEGTMSNLFAARDGVLYTPTLENCGIHGIIREQLLTITCQQKIPLHIKTISHDELLMMDEILLCNSVIGCWPVTDYAGKKFSPGPITALLTDRLKQRVEDNAQAIG